MNTIRISGLFIYPVKSLAGISLQTSNIDNMGLKYDRRWMLVSPDGLFLTQRKIPKMALIKTALDANGTLTLSMKGMNDHTVPNTSNECDTMSVRIWKDNLTVQKVSDKTDTWLSDALDFDCHLVYISDDVGRQCDLDYAKKGDHTGFSDGFPLLLISETSLYDLNQRLESPVEMRRFRPNIVVSGCEAFAEDHWKKFTISKIEMRGVKLCSRCILTTVDPETGERTSREPLATLETYRKVDKTVNFGLNVIQQQHGILSVGDLVEV